MISGLTNNVWSLLKFQLHNMEMIFYTLILPSSLQSVFVSFVENPSSRNPDVGFGISAGAKKVRARLGTDHRLPCLAVAERKRSASLREATTPQTANECELKDAA